MYGSVHVHVFPFACLTHPEMGQNLDLSLGGFIDLLLIRSLQIYKDIGQTDIPTTVLWPLPPDTGQDCEESGNELQSCKLEHAS